MTEGVFPTERDLALFEALLSYRFLRRDQIQRLFFPGVATATVNRRLTKLAAAGYLRRERPGRPYGEGTSQYHFGLAPLAANALAAAGRVEVDAVQRHLRRDRSAGVAFQEHSLAINEFHILVTLAAESHGWVVSDWEGDFQLRERKLQVAVPRELRLRPGQATLPVVPDAFFTVVRAGAEGAGPRSSFFLEIDRGTEAGPRFQQKVVAYLAHRASGDYERVFGRKSLRVLTVVPSAARQAHLLAATRQAGGGNLYWFAV